jgi:hypothetical protein
MSPIEWVLKNLSSGVKSLRLHTDHSPPSNAEGKNVCIFFRKHRMLSFENIKKRTEVKDYWF